MFQGFSQMMGLLGNLPKMKEEFEKLQSRLGSLISEGNAGGGLVIARVNGRFELVGLTLSEQAMAMQDREMLEDLIRSAVNQAMEKARLTMAEETAKLTGGLGLPGGFRLPGMG